MVDSFKMGDASPDNLPPALPDGRYRGVITKTGHADRKWAGQPVQVALLYVTLTEPLDGEVNEESLSQYGNVVQQMRTDTVADKINTVDRITSLGAAFEDDTEFSDALKSLENTEVVVEVERAQTAGAVPRYNIKNMVAA